jgi:hypothetical protein
MPAVTARAAREAREEAARIRSQRYQRHALISQKRYFSMIKQAAKTAVQAILPQHQQPAPMFRIQDDAPAVQTPVPTPTPEPELVELDRPDTPRPDPYTEFRRCEMCFQLNYSQLEAEEQCSQCGHWACDTHAESSCSDRGCAYCRGTFDSETESQPEPQPQPQTPAPTPDLWDFALGLTDQIAAAAVSSYRNYVTGATVAALNTATDNHIDYSQPTNPRRFCFRTIEFDVLPTDYQPDRTISIQHKRYVDSLTSRMFAVARSGAVLNHNNVLITVHLSDDSTPQRVAGSIEYYKYY